MMSFVYIRQAVSTRTGTTHWISIRDVETEVNHSNNIKKDISISCYEY